MVKMPSLVPGACRFPSMDPSDKSVAYAGKFTLVPVLRLMMANGYHPIHDGQALA